MKDLRVFRCRRRPPAGNAPPGVAPPIPGDQDHRVESVIVSRLRDVGFSLYEARVYLALLQEGSQNGNEVAERDGPFVKGVRGA